MEALVAIIFVLAFFALIIGAPIYLIILSRKGEVLQFETTATPDEIGMSAVGQIGVARGWATVTQTPTNVAFTYVRSPNILIVFLLVVFTCGTGILWAVVYWMIASKKESLNLMIGEGPSGNSRVQITSNGWKGKRAGGAIRDAVGLAPGTTVTETENVTPTIPGAATAPIQSSAASPALPQPPPQTSPVQSPPPAERAAPPAAWYDDPDDSSQRRYWNGENWTEDRSPK